MMPKYDFSDVDLFEILLLMSQKATIRQWLSIMERSCPEVLSLPVADLDKTSGGNFAQAMQQRLAELMAGMSPDTLNETLRKIIEADEARNVKG